MHRQGQARFGWPYNTLGAARNATCGCSGDSCTPHDTATTQHGWNAAQSPADVRAIWRQASCASLMTVASCLRAVADAKPTLHAATLLQTGGVNCYPAAVPNRARVHVHVCALAMCIPVSEKNAREHSRPARNALNGNVPTSSM